VGLIRVNLDVMLLKVRLGRQRDRETERQRDRETERQGLENPKNSACS
jgi:hypothetical protein